MRNLVSAIQNRDASALARLAGDGPQPVDRGVHEGVERLVDALFNNLKQVFPASVSTAWRNPNDEAAAKRQWIAAFAEDGISSKQQLSAGMKQARSSGSPFLPSPGQFIAWCKEGTSLAAGLPDEDSLYDMVMTYCARRGLYQSPEAYPWEANSDYWMVTGLYSMMRAQGLSEPELRIKCRGELRKMAARIEAGEQIPPPRAQLEKLHMPVSNEKAMDNVARLKALLKKGKAS
ncbi:replication protein P [Pantoea piersonii]|uniref:replication protein P n=1 Tax=Pantoea piersonii TaxID=2364647 RepID=UPI0028A2309B|nr:replication protein P [Pantoea piersonii]